MITSSTKSTGSSVSDFMSEIAAFLPTSFASVSRTSSCPVRGIVGGGGIRTSWNTSLPPSDSVELLPSKGVLVHTLTYSGATPSPTVPSIFGTNTISISSSTTLEMLSVS